MKTAFPGLNPGLVGHLYKKYGKQIERDEIVSEMFVAAATAGTRTGLMLSRYVCNAVMRQAKSATTLISNIPRGEGDDTDFIERAPNNASIFFDADPCDILIAKQAAEEIERKYGSVHLADTERMNGNITDRGMRKRRLADAAKAERNREAGQDDMFDGNGGKE